MKIKIEDIDQERKRFGGRILNIDGKIRTPFRIPSAVEYRSKQQVPTHIKIDSDFSEVVSDFTNDELKGFLSKNSSFKSRIRVDEQKADIMSYSPIISYYPQLPLDYSLDQRGMKLIFTLALDLKNVNVISIPKFDPVHSYERDLEDYCEEIKGRKKEPMPIIDMGLNEEEFKSKFDTICSKNEIGLVNIIGLRYRNWRSYAQNFLYVWENKEKEILYHCIGVDRTYEQASTMHILQSWGIDIYSIRMQRGRGSKNGKKKKNVRIFDRDTIGVLKYDQYKDEHPDGEISCDCPMCHNLDWEGFEERYGYDENGNLNPLQLEYAGKVHEYFSSSREFDISREHIKEKRLLHYFNSKKYLDKLGRATSTLNNHI